MNGNKILAPLRSQVCGKGWPFVYALEARNWCGTLLASPSPAASHLAEKEAVDCPASPEKQSSSQPRRRTLAQIALGLISEKGRPRLQPFAAAAAAHGWFLCIPQVITFHI